MIGKKRNDIDVKKAVNDKSTRFRFFRQHPWILYPIGSLAFMILFALITIFILSRNLPTLTQLERAGDPLLVSRIYSVDGKILKELFREKRIIVPIDRMPESLIQATIATEDRKFWRHWGVDIVRFSKIAVQNLLNMRIVGGASTITQQLARKVYLNPKKTVIRKLREQLTSLQIERTYSKSEILEMYLNRMPLGRGTHGVQAAARAYFGKNVEDLDIHESAFIVGLLQLPYGYSPDRYPDRALRRRNVVLYSMQDCDFIERAEYDSLKQLPLGVIDRGETGRTIAPYFCEYVTRELEKKYGLQLWTEGYSIYTTLDTRIQACADSAVRSFIPQLEKEIQDEMMQKMSFTQWFDPPLETDEEIQAFLSDSALVDSMFQTKATVQAALVSMDPSNGHVLAFIGGRDFKKWKYNRAVQMSRQPGSAFKPIAYTAAIDNGWPTTTELLNQPVVIIMPDGTRWSPDNYDGTTGGPTTFREALRRSLNMVTARLIQEVIPAQKVVDYAKYFGITTKINPFDGVALGQDVVIPLELVSAYSVFANRGIRVEPIAVLRVEDKDGNILEEAVPRQREVVSEETAYIMVDLLSTAIDRGTGQSARWQYNFYRPAGGKTGTTNDFRNAWFIGFTPQIVAGVWVGFDDERIALGDRRSGARTALPVWAPFMQMAHDTLQLPWAEFPVPSGIVRSKICSETKKIATESCPEIWEEVFFRDLAPTDTCEVHQRPSRRRRNRVIF